MVDSIFLNGTVGVGKSTVAEALSEIEIENGHAHAVINLDDIRRAWPTPAGDPFHLELELANLRDLTANFIATGAKHFILAGVIESASEVPRYKAAMHGGDILICRLEADATVVRDRLHRRHEANPAALGWHLRRADELAGILATAGVDDLVLDASSSTPRELAEAVSGAAGWSSPKPGAMK